MDDQPAVQNTIAPQKIPQGDWDFAVDEFWNQIGPKIEGGLGAIEPDFKACIDSAIVSMKQTLESQLYGAAPGRTAVEPAPAEKPVDDDEPQTPGG